ncbi:hypothetical protein [Pelosinus sp. sgz500959]|uniref:hypothetical protein n=1 Tax=Pelosinus sp. sgz500959 TaxID=3242472 RepID=UPI0036727BF5
MLLNSLTTRDKIIIALVLISLCVLFYFAVQERNELINKRQQATVMGQQQATDIKNLQNQLQISNQNAQMLADFIKQAQASQIQPVNHFTVQAPTVQVATDQVASRINAKDPTLPPQALEKTDNTIVTPHQLTQAEIDKAKKENEANKGTDKPKINEEYGVNVFKNNNYRNWEWSTGYGQHCGKGYIPIGLQRNYSKDNAIEAEVHLDTGMPKNVTGWEVKQVWKTDKLFFMF